jgi:dihydroneopterin aldolase
VKNKQAVNKLFIRNLRVPTLIGVYPHEHQAEQTLLLTVIFRIEIQQAASSDHINDAIDYTTVSHTILNFAKMHSFQLIETFADQCAALLIEKFKLSWLRLTVKKPSALPNADYAGITVERRSE